MAAAQVVRPTPWDLVFAELEADFAAAREEGQGLGRDLRDRAAFASLPVVQRTIARIESPELLQHAPQASLEYLTLLYAAYRFWEAGRTTIEAKRAVLEPALAVEPRQPEPTIPHDACYVRLPHHWFWAQVGPSAPHEPLDGMFVAVGHPDNEITVVAVLGLRAGRAGFSQVSVLAHPAEFAAAVSLARTERFAPVLEGGAAAGFRSIVSSAELLLLTHLALEHTGRGIAGQK